jgi:hypothetical protein
MNQQELEFIAASLTQILNNDNVVRKQGEDNLLAIKSQQPDKYACYLVAIMGDGNSRIPKHFLSKLWSRH